MYNIIKSESMAYIHCLVNENLVLHILAGTQIMDVSMQILQESYSSAEIRIC
jgi:hypothetical protein